MKIFYILVLTLFSTATFAQPTLTFTEMANPGTNFIYKHAESFGIIDTNIIGANRTWNFSGITTTFDPDYVISIINPTQTIHADTFPTSNWGTLEDDVYSFFTLTSSKLERIGFYAPSSGYLYFPNPETEYIFPMALGVQNTDISTYGTYTFECIGYGTVIVPGHTYSNTIMTRVNLDGGFGIVFRSFYWYDSNNGQFVFQYTPGDSIDPQYSTYLDAVVIEVEENSFASNITYNNPVTTSLTVNLISESPSQITYQLFNSIGETVMHGRIEKNQLQQLILNFEGKSNGLYLLSLRDILNPKNQRSIKIIKQ
jgi:hypothetical protein